MKEVIVLVGPPGSGKTSFLDRYYPDAHRVAVDEHFEEPTAPFSLRDLKEAYENVKHEFRLAVRAGIEQIVVDQYNARTEHRHYYIKNAHRYGYQVFVVVMPWTREQAIAAKPAALSMGRLEGMLDDLSQITPGIYSCLPPKK